MCPITVDLITGIAQGGATLGSDRLVSIENVEGTLYDDQLFGTNLANVLQGASGADMLAGRGGADRFVYVQTYDSLVSASDHIQDFSSKQGVRIDLSAVETNEQSGGDPDFKFIGQKDFLIVHLTHSRPPPPWLVVGGRARHRPVPRRGRGWRRHR